MGVIHAQHTHNTLTHSHTHPLTQLSDWYNVSGRAVKAKGGQRLLVYHKTLQNALRAIYPDHTWDSSKFTSIADRVPQYHWAQEANVKEALARAERQLGITQVMILIDTVRL